LRKKVKGKIGVKGSRIVVLQNRRRLTQGFKGNEKSIEWQRHKGQRFTVQGARQAESLKPQTAYSKITTNG